MEFLVKGMAVLVSLAMFIAIHEGGHYLAAGALGLGPHLVFGSQSDAAFAGLGIGVSYAQTNAPGELFVLLAALLPPPLIGLLLYRRENEWAKLVGAVFLMQALMTAIPFPASDATALLQLI